MKIKIFNPLSPYYPFRWFFVYALLVIGLVVYANRTGWRLLSSSSQEQWQASGPRGYHK